MGESTPQQSSRTTSKALESGMNSQSPRLQSKMEQQKDSSALSWRPQDPCCWMQAFWAEAVSTDAYLRNRSPTSLKNMQAWYGRKPGVEHLRVFGSTAYVHISRDSRKKLDSKTRKCILVGYGSVRKGCRLYDRATSQVLFSRNVRFDEQERIGSTPGKETGGEPIPAQNVLELDLDEGSETEENEERIEIRSPPRQPPPRRSNRERRPMDFYGDTVHLTIHQEPTSFNEARSSPEKDQWSRAMDREMGPMMSGN